MTAQSDRYAVNPKIVSETIDGEVIILNLDRGTYYSLTFAGTDAWAALADTANAGEIVNELLTRYDGPRAQVAEAVEGLLGELQREDLIVALGPEAGPATTRPGRSAPARERQPFQAPVLRTYTDMEDLLLLDPIHEVDGGGWPNRQPGKSLSNPA